MFTKKGPTSPAKDCGAWLSHLGLVEEPQGEWVQDIIPRCLGYCQPTMSNNCHRQSFGIAGTYPTLSPCRQQGGCCYVSISSMGR